MSVLEFQDLHVSYGRNEILHGVGLTAETGKITGVIGQNGCGKSTLVKSVFGISPVKSGRILLDGTDVKTIGRRALAERIGYVSQETTVAFDFAVEDVVRMALYHRKLKRGEANEIVRRAMEELQVERYADRSIQTLSGGERKMVFLARCAAQGTETIILDEPTNHLDIRHELFLMNYLRRSGKTILLVIHDLRLAAHYCDRLCLMKEGRVVDIGTPSEVLTRGNVEEGFGIHGNVISIPGEGEDFRIDFDE